jgi:hypothetical protein
MVYEQMVVKTEVLNSWVMRWDRLEESVFSEPTQETASSSSSNSGEPFLFD